MERMKPFDFLLSLSKSFLFRGQRSNSERRPKARIGLLVEGTKKQQIICRDLLDWLRMEHGIEKPSMKLQSPTTLDSDAFVAEVKKLRGKKNPLSALALKNLREEYCRTVEPSRALAAEALTLEQEVSGLVNDAYGLTPDEVKLMWQTAPPRMPVGARTRPEPPESTLPVPRNPQDFLRFLADNYHAMEAMCSQRRRFASEEEIAAFLRHYDPEDRNPARKISRMQELRMLICGVSEWAPPAFLVTFMQQLHDHHAMATPEVIRGWVQSLDRCISQVETMIGPAMAGTAILDEGRLLFFMDEIQSSIQTIVGNVEESCERITKEVADFRAEEEAAYIKAACGN